MVSQPMLFRVLVLALVLGAAAGALATQSDSMTSAGLLVLAGSMTVGGLAPGKWWWLGAMVGAGVTISNLLQRGDAPAGEALSSTGDLVGGEWTRVVAPVLVALAAAGLGSSLQRFLKSHRENE